MHYVIANGEKVEVCWARLRQKTDVIKSHIRRMKQKRHNIHMHTYVSAIRDRSSCNQTTTRSLFNLILLTNEKFKERRQNWIYFQFADVHLIHVKIFHSYLNAEYFCVYLFLVWERIIRCFRDFQERLWDFAELRILSHISACHGHAKMMFMHSIFHIEPRTDQTGSPSMRQHNSQSQYLNKRVIIIHNILRYHYQFSLPFKGRNH